MLSHIAAAAMNVTYANWTVTAATTFATIMAVSAIAFFSIARPAIARLQCHIGTAVFHQNGNIKSCLIDTDHRIYTAKGEEIICRAGTRVTRHPNGAIATCDIGKPHTLDGTPCPPGRVALDAGGSLRHCGRRK